MDAVRRGFLAPGSAHPALFTPFSSQISVLVTSLQYDYGKPLQNNFRPPQGLHKRWVLASFEPTFSRERQVPTGKERASILGLLGCRVRSGALLPLGECIFFTRVTLGFGAGLGAVRLGTHHSARGQTEAGSLGASSKPFLSPVVSSYEQKFLLALRCDYRSASPRPCPFSVL